MSSLYFVEDFMSSIPRKSGFYFESTTRNLERMLKNLDLFLTDFVQFANEDLSYKLQNYFGNPFTFALEGHTHVSYEEIRSRAQPDEVARIHINGAIPIIMNCGLQESNFSLKLIYQSDFRRNEPPEELLHTEFSALFDEEKHFIDSFNISNTRDKIFERIPPRMIPYVIKQCFPRVVDDVHTFADHFYNRIKYQLDLQGFTTVVPRFNLNLSTLQYDPEKDLCFFDQEYVHHAESVISIFDAKRNTEITYRVPYPTFRFKQGQLIIFPGFFNGSLFTLKQATFDAKGLMIGSALGQAYNRTYGFELLPERTLPFEERVLHHRPILQLQ